MSKYENIASNESSPNQRLNQELEKFTYGAATTGTVIPSTHWTEPFIPEGSPTTYVHDLKNEITIAQYVDLNTNLQCLQVVGNGAPELLTGGFYIKRDAQAPLTFSGYVAREQREASSEEVDEVTNLLQSFNTRYENKQHTNITEQTNRKLQALLEDIFELELGHPMVSKRITQLESGIEYHAITILDHELYMEIRGYDQEETRSRIIDFNGKRVPSHLQKTRTIIDASTDLHDIHDGGGEYGAGKARDLVFLPEQAQNYQAQIKQPQNSKELDIVVREADAQFIIDTLEAYTQNDAWKPTPANEHTTPPSKVLLDQCENTLEELFAGEKTSHGFDVSLISNFNEASATKRASKKSIIPGATIKVLNYNVENFTISIHGSEAPESLRDMRFSLDFETKKFRANQIPAQPISFNPLAIFKLIKHELSNMKKEYYDLSVSHRQIRELNDFIESFKPR